MIRKSIFGLIWWYICNAAAAISPRDDMMLFLTYEEQKTLFCYLDYKQGWFSSISAQLRNDLHQTLNDFLSEYLDTLDDSEEVRLGFCYCYDVAQETDIIEVCHSSSVGTCGMLLKEESSLENESNDTSNSIDKHSLSNFFTLLKGEVVLRRDIPRVSPVAPQKSQKKIELGSTWDPTTNMPFHPLLNEEETFIILLSSITTPTHKERGRYDALLSENATKTPFYFILENKSGTVTLGYHIQGEIDPSIKNIIAHISMQKAYWEKVLLLILFHKWKLSPDWIRFSCSPLAQLSSKNACVRLKVLKNIFAAKPLESYTSTITNLLFGKEKSE